ncbi:helix-turn-helix domain-containing protein [Paraburkholderia sp. SIMBA_054]|uniref:helix-turn-helix domain-containing protein n=1 Tax=Paraburkholderia sp. SIMBA_054 TaxID=3085795 RepID=UPI00397D75BD
MAAIAIIGDRALSIKEAAQLLRVSYGTVYAHKEQLGFFRIGAAWRVWPDKLKERAGEYNQPRPAQTELEKHECPSESAMAPTSGTLTSARQAAAELDNLLARPTARRLRSITTG